MEEKLIRSYRLLAIVSAGLCIVIFVVTALSEYYAQPWQEIQHEYRNILMARAADNQGRAEAEQFAIQVRQVVLPGELRIDRCITCHLGTGDLPRYEAHLPFSSHSGDYVSIHPIEKFGCTFCHKGKGRVLEVQDVCGIRGYDPSVSLDYVQALCARCHLAVFANALPSTGADMLRSGLDILRREGCLGCHTLRGVGGHVGPDLTDQGSKTRHYYSFRNVEGDHSITNWLREHFQDPGGVSPGSPMPTFDLPDAEMESLITFVLGQFSPTLPVAYYTSETLQEFKSRQSLRGGREAYSLICSACHRSDGSGKDYREHASGAPSIGNVDFQAVASRDFIEFAVWAGRGTSRMESWAPVLSGLRAHELDLIIDHVRGFRLEGPSYREVTQAGGSLRRGEESFARNCSMCHGQAGEGGAGPSLNSQDFLAIASDEFVSITIVTGRSNTAMPSWSALPAHEVASIVMLLRSWQQKTSKPRVPTVTDGAPEHGEELFASRCARCHGGYGEGGIGPAILNPDFLSAASDGYIGATIAGGRAHTPMFGW